jgi:hypothetical protein
MTFVHGVQLQARSIFSRMAKSNRMPNLMANRVKSDLIVLWDIGLRSVDVGVRVVAILRRIERVAVIKAPVVLSSEIEIVYSNVNSVAGVVIGPHNVCGINVVRIVIVKRVVRRVLQFALVKSNVSSSSFVNLIVLSPICG